ARRTADVAQARPRATSCGDDPHPRCGVCCRAAMAHPRRNARRTPALQRRGRGCAALHLVARAVESAGVAYVGPDRVAIRHGVSSLLAVLEDTPCRSPLLPLADTGSAS